MRAMDPGWPRVLDAVAHGGTVRVAARERRDAVALGLVVRHRRHVLRNAIERGTIVDLDAVDGEDDVEPAEACAHLSARSAVAMAAATTAAAMKPPITGPSGAPRERMADALWPSGGFCTCCRAG